MPGWWCGRCRSDVDKTQDQACKCTSGACPWWYVPNTFIERFQCLLGWCRLRGMCVVCSPPPHYRK